MESVSSSDSSNAVRWLIRLGSVVACIAFWQLASSLRLNFGVVTFRNVPPPTEVVQSTLPADDVQVQGVGLAVQQLVPIQMRILLGHTPTLPHPKLPAPNPNILPIWLLGLGMDFVVPGRSSLFRQSWKINFYFDLHFQEPRDQED